MKHSAKSEKSAVQSAVGGKEIHMPPYHAKFGDKRGKKSGRRGHPGLKGKKAAGRY